MVPDKFNIVDFGGFDLAGQYGQALPGIYDKILGAQFNCVYVMCFGLKFAGFDIAPQYMTPALVSDHIVLNGIISIDRNDVITVPSIEPPAPAPVILPGIFEENGIFTPPSGVDGYAPVTVNVRAGIVSPFYLLNPTEMDAMAAATPQIETTSYGTDWRMGVTSFVKFIAKMNNPDGGDSSNFWVSRKGTYNNENNIAFLGRFGNDRSGIILLPKIPGGVYKTLHLRFEITTGRYSGAYLRIYLQSALGFGSDVWPNESYTLYTEQLASNLVSDNIKIIDISNITDDFYVGFGDYSGFVKIRGLWFET